MKKKKKKKRKNKNKKGVIHLQNVTHNARYRVSPAMGITRTESVSHTIGVAHTGSMYRYWVSLNW